MNPLVSVIILTCNQEKFVRETLSSVFSQTYKNLEIIVSDDCSSDNTVRFAKEFARGDDRCIILESPVNTGITENCNRALKFAQGDYIAWLGGDDLFLPAKIEKQVGVFLNLPDVSLVGTDVEVFFEDESPSYVARCPVMFRHGRVEDFIALNNHIPTSSFMFRKGVVQSLLCDSRLRVVSDWLFNIECALAGGIAYVPEVLTRYRRWSGNVTGSGVKNTYLDDRLISTDILLAKYPWLARALRKARRNMLLSASQRFAFDRKFDVSKELAFASITQCGISLRAIALVFASYLQLDLTYIKHKFPLIRHLSR